MTSKRSKSDAFSCNRSMVSFCSMTLFVKRLICTCCPSTLAVSFLPCSVSFVKANNSPILQPDGKKLKEILDSKNTNVRQIARATGISATTLYSIIQKDSNIRFDFALRLANELEIDVNEICAASPFSGAITEEEIYPTLPDGLNGALDGNRVKVYLKNSLYPLMYLFGKNSMPDVDNLLTSFYQLDDEARKEVVETIQFKLQYHKDQERAEQVKQIKGW